VIAQQLESLRKNLASDPKGVLLWIDATVRRGRPAVLEWLDAAVRPRRPMLLGQLDELIRRGVRR
jgi:hypothetical protein